MLIRVTDVGESALSLKHHEPTLQRFGRNHKLDVVVGGCFGTCLPREEQLQLFACR